MVIYKCGWVAEWLNALVLKTSERASVPGVRIPPHPPIFFAKQLILLSNLVLELANPLVRHSRCTICYTFCCTKWIFMGLGMHLKDRMLAARTYYRIRRDLFGHKLSRERYRNGVTLKHLQHCVQ